MADTTPTPTARPADSPLSRTLLGAYALLVCYASLYPLAGWRWPAASAFAFLALPMPRYVTAFDLAANVLGYLPLGFLAVLALHPRVRGVGAALAALAAGLALSLMLEAMQGFLPARIPSNLDVAANAIGTATGAFAARRLAPWMLEDGPLRRLRSTLIASGSTADLGLTLLGLWLLAQLNPATLAFGTGDLRDLFAVPEGPAHEPRVFAAVEAGAAAANLCAAALIASALSSDPARRRLMIGALVLATVAVKTAAFAILMRAEAPLAWFTPGAQAGALAGTAAALALAGAPRLLQLASAVMLILAATVAVNLAPPNPYLAATLKVWSQGHFLNFNGLTHLVSAAWPFLALAVLVALAARAGGPGR